MSIVFLVVKLISQSEYTYNNMQSNESALLPCCNIALLQLLHCFTIELWCTFAFLKVLHCCIFSLFHFCTVASVQLLYCYTVSPFLLLQIYNCCAVGLVNCSTVALLQLCTCALHLDIHLVSYRKLKLEIAHIFQY